MNIITHGLLFVCFVGKYSFKLFSDIDCSARTLKYQRVTIETSSDIHQLCPFSKWCLLLLKGNNLKIVSNSKLTNITSSDNSVFNIKYLAEVQMHANAISYCMICASGRKIIHELKLVDYRLVQTIH